MKKDTLENLYDKFTEVSEVKTLVKNKGVKTETILIPNWKLFKVSLPLIRKLANDGYTLHDIEDNLASYIETKTNNDRVATLIAQPQP